MTTPFVILRAAKDLLGETLDKRNFRKRIEALGVVRPLNETAHDGTGRPGQLFTFRRRSRQPLS